MSKYQVVEVINTVFDANSELQKRTGVCVCSTGTLTPWIFPVGEPFDSAEDAIGFKYQKCDETLARYKEEMDLEDGWELGRHPGNWGFIEVSKIFENDIFEGYWVCGYEVVEIKE